MSEIENKLHVKEDIMKSLIEKVKVVEERQENFKMESQEVSKSEQTFLNPSDETKNCTNVLYKQLPRKKLEIILKSFMSRILHVNFATFKRKMGGWVEKYVV